MELISYSLFISSFLEQYRYIDRKKKENRDRGRCSNRLAKLTPQADSATMCNMSIQRMESSCVGAGVAAMDEGWQNGLEI